MRFSPSCGADVVFIQPSGCGAAPQNAQNSPYLRMIRNKKIQLTTFLTFWSRNRLWRNQNDVPILFFLPLVSKSLGFRFSARIENLDAGDCIQITCPQCNRTYTIAPYQLRLKFPAHTHLNTVTERFRCKSCPARGNARWAAFTAVADIQALD